MIESPVVDGLTSLEDRRKFGVPGRVVVHLAGVVGLGKNITGLGVKDHRAHRHLAKLGGLGGEFNRTIHHPQIKIGRLRTHDGSDPFEPSLASSSVTAALA